MYHNVLQVFHDVLRCLVSRAAAADCLRYLDNAAGIGDNSAEIANDAAGIIAIDAKVIPC